MKPMKESVLMLTSPSKRQFEPPATMYKRQKVVNLKKSVKISSMKDVESLNVQKEEETICSYHFFGEFDPKENGWTIAHNCYEFTEEYLDTIDFKQALNGKFVKRDEKGIVFEKIMIPSKGIVYRRRQIHGYNDESVVSFKILVQQREYYKNDQKLEEIVAEYANGDLHHYYQIKAKESQFNEIKNQIQKFNPVPCRSRIMEGIYRYKGDVYQKLALFYKMNEIDYHQWSTGLKNHKRHCESIFFNKQEDIMDATIMFMRRDGEIPRKYPDPLLISKDQFLLEFSKISESEFADYKQYSDESE